MQEYQKKVEEDLAERLDVYLTRHFDIFPSRSYIKSLIDTGCVTVNQKVVKAHYKVALGDAIIIRVEEAEEQSRIQPENIPLDIFYEDDYLLIIHKPAGMLVHPVQGCHSGTLVNALMYHCQNLSDVNAPLEEDLESHPELIRPGIVHRLDKDTSGLMVVAKDNRSHVRLARQFEKHRVQKRYVALVKGSVEYDEGLIEAPLGAHFTQWDKRAVSYAQGSKAAETFYRVLKRFDQKWTLISLYPKTGRTHQLRVHMAHLGHPILGDYKYGRQNTFFRMALHALSLAFHHPQNGTFMEFATRIPEDFLNPPA